MDTVTKVTYDKGNKYSSAYIYETIDDEHFFDSKYAYLIIERVHHPNMIIRYDDIKDAEHAFESSQFVDMLCLEDCLDAYVKKNLDNITWLDISKCEKVIPPENDPKLEE